MRRITQADLEAVVIAINRVTKSPHSSYENKKACIGNYHLSFAYGGVSLHRMQNEGGGVSDVFSCGHVTKRELYNRMQSFLRGIEHGTR